MGDNLKTESEIRSKYQTTVPQVIREKIELEVGDTLIWKYDETRKELLVYPKPKSFTEELWGLGKSLWEKESADEFVKKEREGWD